MWLTQAVLNKDFFGVCVYCLVCHMSFCFLNPFTVSSCKPQVKLWLPSHYIFGWGTAWVVKAGELCVAVWKKLDLNSQKVSCSVCTCLSRRDWVGLEITYIHLQPLAKRRQNQQFGAKLTFLDFVWGHCQIQSITKSYLANFAKVSAWNEAWVCTTAKSLVLW